MHEYDLPIIDGPFLVAAVIAAALGSALGLAVVYAICKIVGGGEMTTQQTTKGCDPDNASNNSPHILHGRGVGEEVWFWQNGGWAKKPNSTWITLPKQMTVLGWKYVRAV